MSKEILKSILERLESDEEAALVMLTDSSGSTPGAEGAIMAVFKDGKTQGTVGGGKIEFDLIKRSMEALITGSDFTFNYLLSEKGELKMSCGGTAEGFVKIMKPNEKLVIFGAGHTSQKIAAIAKSLKFDIYVVDDRDEYKDMEAFKGVKRFFACSPGDALEEINLNSRTYVIIVTRGHEHDYEALREVIDKNTAYIGMMGSRKKVKEIKDKLKTEGISQDKINRLYAPVGLDISDSTPEEIAISIISEILAVKNKGTLKHLKNSEE